MLIDSITKRFIWEVHERLHQPFYLYDEQTLKKQWDVFSETVPTGTTVHYAAMANDQPKILSWFEKQQCRVFVGSWEHLKLVEDMGFSPNRITCGVTNLSQNQIAELLEKVGAVLISSETELDLASTIPGKARLLIRVNVAEPTKKFRGGVRTMGLDPSLVKERWEFWTNRDRRLVGIHSYGGTNVHNLGLLARRARKAISLASTLRGLKVVDIGGGFPASSKEEISDQDLRTFWKAATADLRKEVELWAEPGRFLMAPTSVFVTAVISVEVRSNVSTVGTDASVFMFPRRLLFGASDQDHPLLVLRAAPDVAPPCWENTLVVGNTTFSRDVLYKGPMQQVGPGDLLIFGNAGAYCRAAIPRFLGTIVPPEVFVPTRTDLAKRVPDVASLHSRLLQTHQRSSPAER